MATMSKAKPEPRVLPKRFYTDVAVQQNGAAFQVLLDGKPVRTFAKKMLQVNAQQLADAIAAEWRAQAEYINTDTMPLTRLANLTLDRMEADREALLAEMVGYAETDLVCYRAEGELGVRQAQHFNPLLDWAANEFGIEMVLTEGVMPIAQSAMAMEVVGAQFSGASDAELAALSMLLPILGSAVLTLAVWKGRIPIEQALVAARLDEAFQAEQWGEDPMAAEAWANKCRDARACAVFLACAA